VRSSRRETAVGDSLRRTTDEEVVAFVRRTPGAIGYVSGGAALPDTVKAIDVSN
jgi:ABC-type phosphate transport system substrate-binding protein